MKLNYTITAQERSQIATLSSYASMRATKQFRYTWIVLAIICIGLILLKTFDSELFDANSTLLYFVLIPFILLMILYYFKMKKHYTYILNNFSKKEQFNSQDIKLEIQNNTLLYTEMNLPKMFLLRQIKQIEIIEEYLKITTKATFIYIPLRVFKLKDSRNQFIQALRK